MKTPCAIPLFTVVCVLTVLAQAANTSLTNSHARRSLERSNRHHQRHAHPGPHRLSAEDAVVYQKQRVDLDARGPSSSSSVSASSSSSDSASSSSSASASASSPSSTATDSSSSSASATDSASSSASTDSASSSQSVSATDSASSSASASDSASSSPTVTDSATNTASSASDSPSPTVTDPPTSGSPTSTDSPASTTTCDPLDLLCTISSVLSPPTSTPTTDSPASTPAPTSSDPPASTSDSPVSTPAPTSSDPPASTSDSPSPTVTDPPASTSDSPTSTDSPASSASCDPLDVICIGSTILNQSSTPAPTSDTPQTDSSSPTDSATQSPSPTGTPASTTDAPASTSDAVTDIVNSLSTLLPTSTSDKPDSTQIDTSTPTDSSLPTQSFTATDSSTPTQSDKPTGSSQSDQPTETASSQSDQATQTDTFTGTQTISQPPPTGTITQTNSVSDSFIDTKTVTASDSPTDSATDSATQTQSVSFPTLSESPTDSEATATATDSSASNSITDSQASVTMTTQPIPSEYSYITDSSLALTSIPATTTLSFSLIDPDAAFTTASLTQSGTAAPSQAVAFPTQLPTRIFPANRLDPNDPSLQGMVLVSLKFLNTLTWSFVVNNSNTAALLFVYTPQTIANALGISVDQVLTFAMQAFAPADYSGDISQLSTVYLLYIPSDQVDALQQQLLTQNSPLYSDQAGIPKQISQQLDATFPVNAVGLDTTIVGTGASSNGSNSGGADASAASRRDAIIGVCAAFGVILVAVVFWWVYKSWRRRQDKAHRRLTHDSAGMHQAGGYGATTQSAYGTVYGAAPQRSGYAQPHTPLYTTTGAPIPNPFEDNSYEEDPDERRRSFFYAEDSLRGYTVPREEDQGITYTQVVRAQQGLAPNDGKRRAPIQASAISAPILRESSLNW